MASAPAPITTKAIGDPTGAHEDRVALATIEQTEARGDLQPGMTVLACTGGGSTGSSLVSVCGVKGYR